MYLLTRFPSQLKGESVEIERGREAASIINALRRREAAARSQNAAGVENQIGFGRP